MESKNNFNQDVVMTVESLEVKASGFQVAKQAMYEAAIAVDNEMWEHTGALSDELNAIRKNLFSEVASLKHQEAEVRGLIGFVCLFTGARPLMAALEQQQQLDRQAAKVRTQVMLGEMRILRGEAQ